MKDRRKVPGFTVDKSGARVLDDSIWVSPLSEGSYRLVACVADVVSVVPINSHDDKIAAAKGLNVYAAIKGEDTSDRCSPMFGDHSIGRTSSLDPEKERPVIAYIMDFNTIGVRQSLQVIRGSLVSIDKLSYEGFEFSVKSSTHPLHDICVHVLDLARLLWKIRTSSSDGTSDPTESAFYTDGDIEHGLLGSAVIHELMVATNTAATAFVRSAGLPMIYRNQGTRFGGPGGRYEVACHGHASLGIAAYGQFSCPLRRYVDLVNERQLCAAIDGLPSPYSLADLTKICIVGNIAAQKAAALSKAKEKCHGHDEISKLDPFAFSKILKRRGGFNKSTLHEFSRRLDDGLLTPADVAWLLFHRESPADTSIKTELLFRLAMRPNEISRIWSIAAVRGYISLYDCVVVKGGARGWVGQASVAGYDASFESRDPQRARDAALMRLVARMLNLALPSVPSEVRAPLRLVDTRAPERLQTMCRVAGWDMPEFVYQQPEENGRIRGQVCIKTEAFPFQTPFVSGCSERAVIIAASELAISLLRPYAEEVSKHEAACYGIDLNRLEDEAVDSGPMMALEDFCLRYGAKRRWLWIKEYPYRDDYACILEIASGSICLHAEGCGTTRGDTMEKASQNALEVLLGRDCLTHMKEDASLP
jgi:RNB domain